MNLLNNELLADLPMTPCAAGSYTYEPTATLPVIKFIPLGPDADADDRRLAAIMAAHAPG